MTIKNEPYFTGIAKVIKKTFKTKNKIKLICILPQKQVNRKINIIYWKSLNQEIAFKYIIFEGKIQIKSKNKIYIISKKVYSII